MRVINLTDDSSLFSKLKSINKGVFDENQIEKLKKSSFNEILLKLNNSEMNLKVDTNYSKYEGFYLIEKIINDYIQEVFSNLNSVLKKNNREFFNIFYDKFLVENFLKILKIKHLKLKEDITPFLNLKKSDRSFFIEATNIGEIKKLFDFFSKKLNFDSNKAYEIYKSGFLEVQNFIYKNYYNNLFKKKFKYNNSYEKSFYNFLRKEIDIENMKIFLILTKLKKVKLFEEIFIENGNLEKSFFIKNFNKNEKENIKTLLDMINKNFKIDMKNIDLDLAKIKNKKSFSNELKNFKFNSPFYCLKMFFDIEDVLDKIKKILKMKLLNMSDKDFYEVLK